MANAVRTLISFEAGQRSWLDRRSRQTGRPVAQLVREAVDLARRSERAEGSGEWAAAIGAVQGILGGGEDGLAAQSRLRAEWD